MSTKVKSFTKNKHGENLWKNIGISYLKLKNTTHL